MNQLWQRYSLTQEMVVYYGKLVLNVREVIVTAEMKWSEKRRSNSFSNLSLYYLKTLTVANVWRVDVWLKTLSEARHAHSLCKDSLWYPSNDNYRLNFYHWRGGRRIRAKSLALPALLGLTVRSGVVVVKLFFPLCGGNLTNIFHDHIFSVSALPVETAEAWKEFVNNTAWWHTDRAPTGQTM